jgi:diadenosine tetraphosphate (Ap4A) HIT family hydrolase
MDCPFCCIKESDCLYWDNNVKAFYDAYPVTKDHILIVPHRHIQHINELNMNEFMSMFYAFNSVIANIDTEDFNVGFNDGKLAGQTIPHAHLHVIPRRSGDCDDPRGGVRWIFPKSARYQWGDEGYKPPTRPPHDSPDL